MGYRLHVAKTYKVEYALGDAFSHKCEEFHNLLWACGAEYTGNQYDSDFEVSKDDWQKVIDKLKNLDAIEDESERYEIEESIKDKDSTTNEIVKELEYFRDNGDTSDGYLHLSYY